MEGIREEEMDEMKMKLKEEGKDLVAKKAEINSIC